MNAVAPATGRDAAAVIRACPACGDAQAAAVGASAGAFETVVDDTTFRHPPYFVYECAGCGLYFKSSRIADEDLRAYYQLLDSTPFDVDADYPTDRIVAGHLGAMPPGSSVLDYGCSTGRILRGHVRRLTCVGVEPNAQAAAIASARGIAIVTDTELAHSDQKFDAIILTDVYEHLTAPLALLRRLTGHLAAGGWLAIVSGNADAIENRSRLAEHWYFRLPGHVVMLSERHLSWLAERLQLEVRDVRRCSHYTLPWTAWIRQHLQRFAYDSFRDASSGVAARLLRLVPRLRSAEHWRSAPAFTVGADHIVAVLQRRA